jgi:hypothetical protein
MNGKTKGAQKCVFGGFHHSKKIREVDNPSHIGFGKFDPSLEGESKGHGVRRWLKVDRRI